MPHVVVHVIQVTEEVPANCLFKGKVQYIEVDLNKVQQDILESEFMNVQFC